MTDIDTVQRRLEHARDHLAAATALADRTTAGPAELHAAVDGSIQVTNALADLVATVMHRAPAALHRHGTVLTDLLADLRAMHGCLTTGPLLLAPARDDLHQLTTSHHAGPMVTEAPAHDLADQQRPVQAESTDPDQEQALHEIGNLPSQADPADQRRGAPVLDDTNPGLWATAGPHERVPAQLLDSDKSGKTYDR